MYSRNIIILSTLETTVCVFYGMGYRFRFKLFDFQFYWENKRFFKIHMII